MTLLAQTADAVAGNTAEVVVFWVFAVLALGSAIALVSMRNIVHGALMLVLNFMAIAGLYLTLESRFLSIVQVLVYGGAIMVLFLFVIMLLGVDKDDLLQAQGRNRILAIVGGALLAGALLFAVVGPYTSEASICGQDAVAAEAEGHDCAGLAEAYGEDDGSGVAFLGRALFTRYTFPFELSALLLTVATIGAVILARRKDLAPEDEDELEPEADGDDPVTPVAVAADGTDAEKSGTAASSADLGDSADAIDASVESAEGSGEIATDDTDVDDDGDAPTQREG